MQVLADAAAVDAKYASGASITPLCGLPLAVKDTIDVSGYRTTAATPGLAGELSHLCNTIARAHVQFMVSVIRVYICCTAEQLVDS